MADFDITGLWSDDPQATTQAIEQFFSDNMMEDGGLWAIQDWNESTLQMYLYMKMLEAGIDVSFEKGRKRRADLIVQEGDRRIVLELKYAQPRTVILPEGPKNEKVWKRRDRCQQFIEQYSSQPGGLWDMQFTPYNKKDPTTMREFFITKEQDKNKETNDYHNATDFYVVLGVGHTVAVEKIDF